MAVIAISSFSCFAQPNYRFRQYGTKDGLYEPEGHVFQDKQGFVWFAHAFAIDRFDGYTFKPYRNNPTDTLLNFGAKGIGIGYPFYSDRTGTLWIHNNLTESHHGLEVDYLLKYERSLDGFVRYTPEMNGAAIGPIEFDVDSTLIWIGGYPGKGLFSFNPITKETSCYFNERGDSLSAVNANSITKIKDHGTYLMLTSHDGFWKWNKKEKEFKRTDNYPMDWPLTYDSKSFHIFGYDKSGNRLARSDDNQTLVILDSAFSVLQKINFPDDFKNRKWTSLNDGTIWFDTGEKGLCRFDASDSSYYYYKNNPGDPYSCPVRPVEIQCDRNDNLWISTIAGVNHGFESDLKFYNSSLAEMVGPGNYRWPYFAGVYLVGNEIWISSNGRLWTAPLRLEEAIRFKPFATDIPADLGIDFYKSWLGKEFLWTSSAKGVVGLHINPQTKKVEGHSPKIFSNDPHNQNTINGHWSIWALWEDPKENLWVGSWDGLDKIDLNKMYGTPGSVSHFRPNPLDSNSISHNVIRDIAGEDENSFWVATEISVDLFHDGRFEHVFKNKERVSSVFKSADGTVFIGTEGGLYEGKKINNRYRFVKSALVTQAIRDSRPFAEDPLARLWISTIDGVVCLNREENTAIKLNEQDGLLNNRLGRIHCAWANSSPDGIMVFGFMGNGISIFDPMTLKINRKKTYPVLTKLLINNKLPIVGPRPASKDDYRMPIDITVAKEIVLDYLHNNFSIEFSAMEMIVPERNLYQHKLEGYDPDWITTDYKNRMASYTNLDAGNYTFKVKASNYQGIWSDQETTLSVVVLPPPWKTWWAYSGYGIFVVSLLLWARKNIIQREQLKSNLRMEHMELEKEHFALEKAKEVDRVKTSFFTNISHEFRTPLTLIKAPVQSMIEQFVNDQKDFDRDKIVQQLKLVQRNSDLLLKLINQLMDLAKLESGTLKIEKSEGDLFSFIRAIASTFETLAWEKNISIQLEIPEVSRAARFDKDKLETILINLINNAIKFTSIGSVKLTASIEESSLVLTVKDTGIGIPEDQQYKIFERFHQVSETHTEAGTGIGLSLVKELVALMDGEISVTSKVEKGSEFKVKIPIELVSDSKFQVQDPVNIIGSNQVNENMKRKSDNLEPTAQNLGPATILVVEDNADLRAFIVDSLGNEFQFLEANSGKLGLDIALEQVPDLIISDLMMPEMDGMEMLSQIKADTRISHIPIILLTAKSTEDSMLQGLATGADDYLTKPFNKNELHLKIRNRIALQHKIRERVKLEIVKASPRLEVPSADEQFLIKVKTVIHQRLTDEQLSVDSLAEEIGLSRVQLYRKVTALTGVSVHELIRSFRMQKAAQLLAAKWGPVSQVAYEVGFSNLSYFSKVFKREFGVSPSEFTGT